MSSPILCFEHCNGRILCLNLPKVCPVCTAQIEISQLGVKPFSIPSPFTNDPEPMSVLLKPTNGTFLNDYQNKDDLHIGITGSTGVIHEFLANGVLRGEVWKEFLNIKIPTKVDEQVWDEKLEDVIRKFHTERYDENSTNCFSFVIEFFSSRWRISKASRKEDFASQFLTESTSRAARYISLYRLLKDKEFFLA